MIYQATLRRELHRSIGLEWGPVDSFTGMAEVTGVRAETIRAWSQHSSQLREWAANHLTLVEGEKLSPAQLAAAQKATRPKKPEELSWVQLQQIWREDERGLRLDRAGRDAARAARIAASRAPFDRARLAGMAEKIDKAGQVPRRARRDHRRSVRALRTPLSAS